jgi:hypothetical protein
MAKLDEEERESSATYTDSKGKPSFPIPDKNHARLALAMIGHAPAAEKPKIRAKANRMLGRTRAR